MKEDDENFAPSDEHKKITKDVLKRLSFNFDQIGAKYTKRQTSGMIYSLEKDKMVFDPEFCTATDEETHLRTLKREKTSVVVETNGKSVLSAPCIDPEETDQKKIVRYKKINQIFETLHAKNKEEESEKQLPACNRSRRLSLQAPIVTKGSEVLRLFRWKDTDDLQDSQPSTSQLTIRRRAYSLHPKSNSAKISEERQLKVNSEQAISTSFVPTTQKQEKFLKKRVKLEVKEVDHEREKKVADVQPNDDDDEIQWLAGPAYLTRSFIKTRKQGSGGVIDQEDNDSSWITITESDCNWTTVMETGLEEGDIVWVLQEKPYPWPAQVKWVQKIRILVRFLPLDDEEKPHRAAPHTLKPFTMDDKLSKDAPADLQLAFQTAKSLMESRKKQAQEFAKMLSKFAKEKPCSSKTRWSPSSTWSTTATIAKEEFKKVKVEPGCAETSSERKAGTRKAGLWKRVKVDFSNETDSDETNSGTSLDSWLRTMTSKAAKNYLENICLAEQLNNKEVCKMLEQSTSSFPLHFRFQRGPMKRMKELSALVEVVNEWIDSWLRENRPISASFFHFSHCTQANWIANVALPHFTHTASLKELFVTGRAVNFNGKLSVTAEHNHLGDSARVELKRLQGVVQRKAVLSKEAPRSIVADCIAGVSEEAKPLVRRSLLARNIRRFATKKTLSQKIQRICMSY
uniref:Uncharacterized protein n=1 Tax=Ditylenchus dipsaci TaxID=166011 RepID=A0A915DI14_9BILA